LREAFTNRIAKLLRIIELTSDRSLPPNSVTIASSSFTVCHHS
jgi:hypothetical protein